MTLFEEKQPFRVYVFRGERTTNASYKEKKEKEENKMKQGSIQKIQ